MWDIIVALVDAEKLGGWVRAGVASVFAIVLAKSSLLSSIFDPAMQAAVGAVLSGLVVGVWSHVAKAAK